MRLFMLSAGVFLALFILTGCGGSSQAAPKSCTDLCHVMTSFAAELRVSSPVGNVSECQSGCSIATESSKQAAVDCAVALSEATPEDRAEMLREMQLDPPLFD
jgi:hypothetical protein